MSIASSIISGFFGIGSSLLGASSARDQQEREQEYNSLEAAKNRTFQRDERIAAQQFNMDMWNMANDYNSPAAQIERARAAGISPNAVIGGLDTSAARPVTTSPMSGSQASYSGSIASSLLTLNPEVAQMVANVGKTVAETDALKIQNDFAPKFNDTMLKKAEAEIDEIGKRAGYTEVQTRQMKEMFPLLYNKSDVEIQKMREEINTLFEERKLIVANTANSEANTANTNEDVALKQWERKFREKWNVSPNAGLINGIVQLAVSDEKGAEIAQALCNTLFNTVSGVVSGVAGNVKKTITERLPKRLRNVVPWLVDVGDGIRNLFTPAE